MTVTVSCLKRRTFPDFCIKADVVWKSFVVRQIPDRYRVEDDGGSNSEEGGRQSGDL